MRESIQEAERETKTREEKIRKLKVSHGCCWAHGRVAVLVIIRMS